MVSAIIGTYAIIFCFIGILKKNITRTTDRTKPLAKTY